VVDIHYVLFIIDKFAGATNIIDELTIVKTPPPPPPPPSKVEVVEEIEMIE
jgi:hypothetical protein